MDCSELCVVLRVLPKRIGTPLEYVIALPRRIKRLEASEQCSLSTVGEPAPKAVRACPRALWVTTAPASGILIIARLSMLGIASARVSKQSVAPYADGAVRDAVS